MQTVQLEAQSARCYLRIMRHGTLAHLRALALLLAIGIGMLGQAFGVASMPIHRASPRLNGWFGANEGMPGVRDGAQCAACACHDLRHGFLLASPGCTPGSADDRGADA